jgi:hypothetical protein
MGEVCQLFGKIVDLFLQKIGFSGEGIIFWGFLKIEYSPFFINFFWRI